MYLTIMATYAIVLFFVFCFVCPKILGQTDDTNEALRECANIHKIEIIKIPHSHASFANSKCLLKCYSGNDTFSTDAINDNFPCPLEPSGVCVSLIQIIVIPHYCICFTATLLHD